MDLISLSIASIQNCACGDYVACLYVMGVGIIKGNSRTTLHKVTADFPYVRPFPRTVPLPVRFGRPERVCKSMEISRVVSYTVQIKSRSSLGITGT
jgi:hypothetical protein